MTTTINNEHKKLNVPNSTDKGNVIRNVPHLRFPEFEGEWEKKRLEECVEFLDGLRKPIKSEDRKSEQGLYPYYGASGIIDYIDGYIFDGEYILLSEDGANIIDRNYRVAFIAKGKIWVNNHAHVLQPYDGFDINFLSETLERLNYAVYNTGTTMPKLNQEVCRNINLKIPTTKEQNKIGNLLSLLNKRIATQNKIIDKLQSLIKGIRNDVFGKLRKNIGFNAVVGDVLDYEQPQSYIVEDTEYTNEGTPVLTANKAFVLGYTSETNGIYGKGDCIIFDDFTLDCKYVDFPFKVKSSAIKILTAKNKELLRYTFEFLKYLDLSAEEHKRHYIAETQNQEIILPTVQMVKTIAHIFSTLSLRMETAVKQRNVFEKQKQYLLRQMFI